MTAIKDMMPGFELFQPATLEDALRLLGRYREDGWVLSGGLDSFDWFKDRVKRPRAVIDIAGISELSGVREQNGMVEIGAMTTLTEVARNPIVTGRVRLLADAAAQVATPQIRNVGTLGGNLCQDTRCWYYRSGWPCYRAGGNICYASAPEAMNREHAVMNSKRCVAVSPSDTAAAVLALDAQMVIRDRRSERVVEAADFFVGPAKDITRMTDIESGELLTTVRIPTQFIDAQFYFEKVRDRNSWDFPLLTVASAVVLRGGAVSIARVAVNGVAATPVRLIEVEQSITGQRLTEETATRAADLAARSAKALRHNDYKLPLMRNLVRRALRPQEA